MKIKRIAAYQVDLPVSEGSYKWSGGRSAEVFDSTIVRIETDGDVVGHGEACPLGSFYLPAYGAGVRAGIAELAPHLIGADPTQLVALNRRMDTALMGHPYVKTAIDIACWDILGQQAGLSRYRIGNRKIQTRSTKCQNRPEFSTRLHSHCGSDFQSLRPNSAK